jgi:hypothetical protein
MVYPVSVSTSLTHLTKELANGSGVRKEVYNMLFAQCQRCNLIYTVEGFYKHSCQLQLADYRNFLYGPEERDCREDILSSPSNMVMDI